MRPHVEIAEQLKALHAAAEMKPGERTPQPGPQLTLAERDRRYAGLRALMETQGFDAIVVGSFQGRERLESYLIDDFLDAVVVLPAEERARAAGLRRLAHQPHPRKRAPRL